jgi:GAF domain-containing protein
MASLEERKLGFGAVFQALENSTKVGRALREEAMELIYALPGYDWVGVYLLEGNELVLDAYRGASTDHTRIPVGTGVCGTAVKTEQNQVVGDVRSLENYLACSLETRSEIVVLMRRRNGEIVGQIDIDGHVKDEFQPEDERFLEELAERLVDRWS